MTRLAICVLPFANMSGDAEQEYFSDGITEDIITDLSKVAALIVVSRNSAFTFKGKNVDIPAIARQLDVSHVLEGSVRKSGGRVRITAQLIDGAGGGHVWAERYDRDLADIFALQDEISRAIVTAMKLQLLPAEGKAMQTRGTNNLDAYNLYLMARKFHLTGSLSSTRRYEAIIRLCRRATELDPNYARAWALLAVAQSGLQDAFGGGSSGLEAANRALALDPNLADAYTARARVALTDGDFERARVEIEAGLARDSDSFEIAYAAGMTYFALRRHGEAASHWRRAAELSPADYISAGMVMTSCVALGDAGVAQTMARETLARVEKIVAREPDNGTALAFMIGALAQLGEESRARALAARALLIDPDNTIMRYNIARAFASGLKDIDGALDLLEPVFARLRRGSLDWVGMEPDLDILRSHPRFQAMLAKAEERTTG